VRFLFFLGLSLAVDFLFYLSISNSVGTNPGIESGGFDSFDDFCGRLRRLDSNVKESIPNRHDSQTKAGKKTLLKAQILVLYLILSHQQPFYELQLFKDYQKCLLSRKGAV
jgi:hypothetical protein